MLLGYAPFPITIAVAVLNAVGLNEVPEC